MRKVRVKRVELAFTEYVRQIYNNNNNTCIYMKNPLFDSLVWGSLRLAPIIGNSWSSGKYTCINIKYKVTYPNTMLGPEGIRITEV